MEQNNLIVESGHKLVTAKLVEHGQATLNLTETTEEEGKLFEAKLEEYGQETLNLIEPSVKLAPEMYTSKVKHFTHSDLDGVGCIGVSKHLFGEVDYEICNYHDIDEKVIKFCSDIFMYGNPGYKMLLITDISVKEEAAEYVDRLGKLTDIKVLLIDHHLTTKPLAEKYPWINVTYESGRSGLLGGTVLGFGKTSATSLLFDTFQQDIYKSLRTTKGKTLAHFRHVENLVEYVRLWDTFEWIDIDVELSESSPFILQTIFGMNGADTIIETFLHGMDDTQEALAVKEVNKIEKYIEDVSKNVTIIDWEGYKVGVVFAEANTSLLGNRLHSSIADKADFVCIVNMVRRTYSLRTTNKSINLGEISKTYLNGGGHPPAAGAEMSVELSNLLARSALLLKTTEGTL